VDSATDGAMDTGAPPRSWFPCSECGTWVQFVFIDSHLLRNSRRRRSAVRPICQSCLWSRPETGLPEHEGPILLLDWTQFGKRLDLPEIVYARFDSHVGPPTGSGCREWTAERTYEGYGRFRVWTIGRWRSPRAHRFVYQMHHGPILNGYELDHKCGNPSCVEITHLQAITHSQNIRLGFERKRQAAGQYRSIRTRRETASRDTERGQP
jgi:hypothetical protein